jgi:hypothetical protein
MASPTLVDMAGRTKPMADKKKHWIKSATSNSHGQFRAKAEKAGETTRAFAHEHEGDQDKTGQQSRLALALMGATKQRERQKRLYPKMKD